MSLNIFEIIIDSEKYFNSTLYRINYDNNTFSKFNEDGTPKSWILSGLQGANYSGDLPNYDFSAGSWYQDIRDVSLYYPSLSGVIVDAFQAPEANFIDSFYFGASHLYSRNHGMTQDGSTKLEAALPGIHGYGFVGDFDGVNIGGVTADNYNSVYIHPDLDLLSHSSSYLGDELVEEAGVRTATFVDGDLTGWNLNSGVTDASNGIADYAHLTANTYISGEVIMATTVDGLKDNTNYKIIFTETSGSDEFFIKVIYNYDEKYPNGVLDTRVPDAELVNVDGEDYLCFTTSKSTKASIVLITKEAPSSSKTYKVDSIRLYETSLADRVAGEDDFAWLPNNISRPILSKPWGLSSIDPERLLNYGSYRTFNVFNNDFKGDLATRSCKVAGGDYGSSNRYVEIITNDSKSEESARKQAFKLFPQELSQDPFFDLLSSTDSKYTDSFDSGVYGKVMPPTVFSLANHNKYNRRQAFKLTYTVPSQTAPIGSQLLDNTHPNFSNAYNSSVGVNLVSDSYILNSNSWTTPGGWSFTEGEVSHSGTGNAGIASTTVNIVKGQTYLVEVQMSQTRNTEFKFGFQTEWTTISFPEENPNFTIQTEGSGSVTTTIQFRNKFTTLSNTIKINRLKVYPANKIHVETTRGTSGTLNSNPQFYNDSSDWSTTGTFFYSTTQEALQIGATSSTPIEVQTVTSYLQPNTSYVIEYKARTYSGDTFLEVYNGVDWISIPNPNNKSANFEFLFSGSTQSPLKIKVSTTSATSNLYLKYVDLKSLGADLAYVNSSNNLVVKPWSTNTLKARIYRAQLFSGQEYRFVLKEANAASSNLSSVNDSDIDYTITFSKVGQPTFQGEQIEVLSSMSRAEGYADSDGSGKILGVKLIAPAGEQEGDTYVDVAISINATFPGKRSSDYVSDKDESLEFEYFDFRQNNLKHSSKLANSVGNFTSENNFVVSCSPNIEYGIHSSLHSEVSSFGEVSTELYSYNLDTSERFPGDYLQSAEEHREGLIDATAYLNVQKLVSEGGFLSSVFTHLISPINDCPKDYYGFYTGGSVTTPIIFNNVRSSDLHFFADNISGNTSLFSEFRINEITFETHEHNYITKCVTVSDAVEFYYNPLKSSIPPLTLSSYVTSDFTPLNPGETLNVSWDVHFISGSPLVIDFGSDSKVIIDSSGVGSQSVKIKDYTYFFDYRIANESECFSLGSEELTNNSFTSSSNWTIGTSWSYSSYFGAMAVASPLTSPPSDLATRYTLLKLVQYGVLTVGQEYEIVINVSANPGGILEAGVLPILGTFTPETLEEEQGLVSSEYTSGAGEHVYRGVAANTDFMILASPNFVGFINSVSVKAITFIPVAETKVILNSLNVQASASTFEVKSEKWGNPGSNNESMKELAPNGKNISPYSSALRVFSADVSSDEPHLISGNHLVQIISDNIDYSSVGFGDSIVVKIKIPYMNSGANVQFKFPVAKNDVTVYTITSEGEHEFSFQDIDPSTLIPYIVFDVIHGGSTPLDILIEYVTITGEKIIGDKNPVRLDLLNDFNFNYTLSKKDFNSLDKISGDYSKTLELPATSNNKKALNFSNELDTIISETQKDGIGCSVKSGGENIFKGLLFLNETNIDENGQTFLDAVIRSGNSSWAETLKSMRLRDLPSNKYSISPEDILGFEFDDNETESKSIIERLGDGEILDFQDREIVFPLIDNGRLGEDFDENTYIGWDNVKAAYRISNVMFKIFEEAGYSLDSEFFRGGGEWSEDATANFSGYIQNLIGIAPSISYTDEEVAKSEVDLSYTSYGAKSQGFNVDWDGVEESAAKTKMVFTPSVKPGMHSHLLNKDFGQPLNYYACDYAFIRFDKVNTDKASNHFYSDISLNANGDLSADLSWSAFPGGTPSTINNEMLRSKVGFARSKEKSFITVNVSGYYDTSFASTITFNGVPGKNKFTVGLLLDDDSSTSNYYRERSSYGAEFFDIQDDSYVSLLPTSGKIENAKLNVNRIQYLKAGERYNIIVLFGVEKYYGGHNQANSYYFSVHALNMNLKLCKDIAPMKGKNNILYKQQADPKASYKNVLPDVSCLDFVVEVSKLFNLIWDVDEHSKTAITEPFEEFYRTDGYSDSKDSTPALYNGHYRDSFWYTDSLDSNQVYDESGYVYPPEYGVFYPTWSATAGTVYSAPTPAPERSAVRITPLVDPVAEPHFYLTEVVSTIAGNEYELEVFYETNSPLEVLVGGSIGGNSSAQVLIHGDLNQPLTENDYNRDRYTLKFKAVSTTTHISFRLPLGKSRAQYVLDNPTASVVTNAYSWHFDLPYISIPAELYHSAFIFQVIVTPIFKSYIDWTDKALITNVKENSIIKSNINYKMNEDASDYEVNLKKSGSMSSLFGDKFVDTGFSKLNEDENISLSIFSAAKMNHSSLINSGGDFLLIPRIWSKPDANFEPQSNSDLPLPNNSHEHKLAVLDGVKHIENGNLNYGLNSIWNYAGIAVATLSEEFADDEGVFTQQIAKSKSYLSATSYSIFDEDSPNLTFSSDFSKGLSKSLYDIYHKPLIDMLMVRDKIAIAQVHLTSTEVASLDFRNLIHINGNIYILNKVKDFNFSGETTEVELLLVTPTK